MKRHEKEHLEPHVIFRKPRWTKSCPHQDGNSDGSEREGRGYFPVQKSKNMSENSYLLVEPDDVFPNEIDTNGLFNIKARNYFPSSFESSNNDRREISKNERFYVELAIFVDRDLYRHMKENFPIDTDEHIIQVVLAMINAVSRTK